jgi:hypothetical protein
MAVNLLGPIVFIMFRSAEAILRLGATRTSVSLSFVTPFKHNGASFIALEFAAVSLQSAGSTQRSTSVISSREAALTSFHYSRAL